MASPRPDRVLQEAVDLAREAVEVIADPGTIGEHLGFELVAHRLGVHYFRCASRGYPGWRWAVSLSRVPRGKLATVCETTLKPGEEALLSPPWVPYAARLAPGDIGPGDITPRVVDDPHLEFGFEATGEEDVDAMAQWELGLGRVRVLSAQGRAAAAQRWYEGEAGPATAVAQRAPAKCATCGYVVPLPGVLRQVFGVCANEWSPSDGRVVALSHGCGAHSEADVAAPESEVVRPPILDDFQLDVSD